MPDAAITVDCSVTGQIADFYYDTDNSFSQFINDLQELDMAWAKGKPPEYAGISIDGPGIVFTGNEKMTLRSMGIRSGSVVRIMDDQICGGHGKGYMGHSPRPGLRRRSRKKLTKR